MPQQKPKGTEPIEFQLPNGEWADLEVPSGSSPEAIRAAINKVKARLGTGNTGFEPFGGRVPSAVSKPPVQVGAAENKEALRLSMADPRIRAAKDFNPVAAIDSLPTSGAMMGSALGPFGTALGTAGGEGARQLFRTMGGLPPTEKRMLIPRMAEAGSSAGVLEDAALEGGLSLAMDKSIRKVLQLAGIGTKEPSLRRKIGDAIRDPETGELLSLKKKAADVLVPESPARVKARDSEKLAQDLMRREKEQARIDNQIRIANERIEKSRLQLEKARLAAEKAKAAAEREAAKLQKQLQKEYMQLAKAEEEALAQNARWGRTSPSTLQPPTPQQPVPQVEDVWAGRSKPIPPSKASLRPPQPTGTGAGLRPTPDEQRLTEMLQKRILMPDEMMELRQAFGDDWVKLRGEGVSDMQARLLGILRSRRAAQGMVDR